MRPLNIPTRQIVRFLFLVLLGGSAYSQTTLSLSSGSGVQGGSVSLNLSLSAIAGSQPTALDWGLSYVPGNVTAIGFAAGPALTAAGKTLSCNAISGSALCVASGMNSNAIGSGVVAVATVTLSATSSSSVPISLSNLAASLANGMGLVVFGTNGTIAVQAGLPSISALQCSPTSLASAANSTCTVTLSGAAPAGGASVALTSTNSNLTVAASVTVAAGATTATFSATAGTISSNQSATVTATYNGSSANTSISLVAPVRVSSLACNPTSLGQNASSTCTVTLTQAAPTGGAAVTLTNSNATLTVPASVTVAAGGTTATFNATTTTVSSNQSATVTATYNSSSANATISLAASVLVSGVACNPTSLGPNASSTCTVTLTQAAPAGGASVALTSTNATLTVPASVVVAAAATSAIFNASTTTIASSQSATITASYNNTSATATITLVAPVGVSVNPATTALAAGQAQQFTAAVTGGTGAGTNPVVVHGTMCGPQAWPGICTIPATTAGNLLVVAYSSYNNAGTTPVISAITDNSGGKTYQPIPGARSTSTLSASGYWNEIWYASNIRAGTTSLTITPSTSETGDVYVWEVGNATVVDQTGELSSQEASATPGGAPVTTTKANEIILTILHPAPDGNPTGIDSSNPFVSDSTTDGMAWAHLITTSVGTYAAEWDQTSTTFASSTVSFMGGSGGGAVTWTLSPNLGTINAAGLYTAPAIITTPQTVTVTATSVADPSKLATAFITLLAPVSISVTPTAVSLLPGQTQQFTSLVTGGTGNTTVGWSLSPNLGGISATGLYTAPSSVTTQQTVTVTTTSAADPTKSATATVTLLPSVLVSALVCNPTSLGQNASSTCKVTLTQAASTGGAPVALTNSNATLTVPASVTVAAGATTATFNATTTTISSNQSATVTATYNSSSANAMVSLVAPVLVSSLTCNPTSLGQNASSTCTVTLTQVAPAGGAIVALTNTNATLTVPGSVTVNAGATTATFSGTTTTINSNQSATVTATYNSSSANAMVSLVAPISLVSLNCTPTSLTGGALSACIVTLSQASVSWSVVSISSNDTNLTVPASVAIRNGTTTGTFNVMAAAAIVSTQNATVNAVLGNSTASTNISLVGVAAVSGLSCAPASIGQNASTSCTVTLINPAPASGAVVTISNSNAPVNTPGSVVVNAGATTATFNATTATIGSNQSATITATYNSSSANATVSLVAPVLVSSLTCNPTSLGQNTSSTCTVTLTQAAPAGGANVTLTNTNATLTVQTSVTVAAGATTATFNATTATIGSNQSAIITATYNSSSANATVSLVAPVLVSSLTCNPTSLGQNASSTCTVTLTQAAPAGGLTVTLATTNPTLVVPASVTVATGATAATVNATTNSVPSNQAATVTSTVGSSTGSATLSLLAPTGPVSLNCSPSSLTGGALSACIVTLGQPSVGWSVVSISSNNPNLTVPASVAIRNGTTTGSFNVLAAGTIASNQSAIVTTTFSMSSVSTNVGLVGSNITGQVTQMSCSPKSLTAASRGICRITLGHVEESTRAEVRLSSSSASVRLPNRVMTRPGQSVVEFQLDALSSDDNVVVAASVGADTVRETVMVTQDRSTAIHVPGPRFVKYGSEVRFRVSSGDPAAILSTGVLPAGAYFDDTTGEFWWTPDGTQLGAHDISFYAIDSAGVKTDASVTVAVDSGAPEVTEIVNAASRSQKAACSPGAIAAIKGRWLSDGTAEVSDPSGNSMEVAGTKVWVNGVMVPVLSASSTEVNILCPYSVAGGHLQFVVQTDHGIAQPMGRCRCGRYILAGWFRRGPGVGFVGRHRECRNGSKLSGACPAGGSWRSLGRLRYRGRTINKCFYSNRRR